MAVPRLVISAVILIGRYAGNFHRHSSTGGTCGVLVFSFDQFRQDSTSETMNLCHVLCIGTSCPQLIGKAVFAGTGRCR